MNNGHYKAMWLVVMFDLPTNTKQERKDSSGFRVMLLDSGFSMMQYSIYQKYFGSNAELSAMRNRIKNCIPVFGEVRTIGITDKQFGLMEVYQSSKKTPPEQPYTQLQLF